MNTSGYRLNLPISKVHQVYHPFWKNQDRYLAFLMTVAVDKHLNPPQKNEVMSANFIREAGIPAYFAERCKVCPDGPVCKDARAMNPGV